MRLIPRILLSILMVAAWPLAAKDAVPPSPAETFQLYIRTFLRFDTEAARTLQDAIEPRYGAGIVPKPEDVAAMAALVRSGGVPGFPTQAEVAGSGEDPVEKKIMQSMQLISAPLYDTFTSVACTVGDVTITSPGEPAEGKVATFAYTCLVPDVSRTHEAFQAAMNEPSPERMEAFANTYIAALKGPRNSRVEGTFTLSAATVDGPWYDPDRDFISVLYALQMAMVPFADLHEETEVAKVPPLTGVPICDVLIARHRACMTRRAPDALPVVEEMADELEQMSAFRDARDMTRHCKTLHLLLQTQWGPECFATP
ncbi:hypothetical protein ACTJI2_15765 [Pseudoxanthomonas sp. 22568]|uniref:hypothetical protein n=1 Tax=Pseudoxanthomonas sp. 22568 TaxID=3453945 RepID=UPI003F83FF08